MRAPLFEKSWNLQKLDENRLRQHQLHQHRSGFFHENQGFPLTQLAKLLQEIAVAKLEELRLLSFIDHAEQQLREDNGKVALTLIGATKKKDLNGEPEKFLPAFFPRAALH